ncbi:solute carrier organic anion transporter family member 4C1-like, partial [Physella acuta]|uniref:solute carrier organic anion transporter family member 4C1-like n=1 Tax=Physella acuta TaxID=109671 RepID=UPI0027DD07EF
GAWWLGYVVFGSLALAAAMPLFCFPRRLPGQRGKGHSQQDKGEHQKGENHLVTEYKVVDREYGSKINVRVIRKPIAKTLAFIKRTTVVLKLLRKSFPFQDFLSSILRLLINPVYMCLTISSILVIFSVSGTSAYTPKYLEAMFNLPAYKANYILAGEVLCSSCVGSFVGGFLTRRFKMSPMVALKFAILVICISLMATVTGFFFQCEQPKVYNWPGENNTCSRGCNCEDNSYFPICGSDGRTYYSPCTAGCVEREKGVYLNCTCIAGGTASSGTCDYSCAHLYPYAVFFGIRLLFGTLSIIPKLILLLRCVNNKDKSLAIGFESFLVSLLGWLLGPLVFGYVIDGICVQWDSSCGVRGRCLLYDHRLFQLKLHGYIVVPGAGCLLFMFIAFFYARATGCLEGEATPGTRDVTEMTLVIDSVKHAPDEENHISREGNDTDGGNHTSDDVNTALHDVNNEKDIEDREKKYFEDGRP